MNKTILIVIGILCTLLGAWFIITTLPLVTLDGAYVLREYTGYNSGVKEDEYYLLLTQTEVDNFIAKKKADLKHSLPIATTPKISSNEICLFIFVANGGTLITDVIEEQNRVVFKAKGVLHLLDPDTFKSDIFPSEGVDFVQDETEMPFGYFILPKTNKKIVIERIGVSTKGELVWYTVKEFNPK